MDSQAFGRRVRELREKKGWTLEVFADFAQMDFSYLSKVENAKKDLELSSLIRILKALDVSPADFFSVFTDI